MADTKYNSKIIFYGETLMDLTGDTVDAASLLKGKTAHDKTGAPITGTCPYDADTSDATATAAEILFSKTAYVDGAKVTGSMPNKGAVTLSIVDKSPVAIPAGYHDGSGSATIDSTEAAKIIGRFHPRRNRRLRRRTYQGAEKDRYPRKSTVQRSPR